MIICCGEALIDMVQGDGYKPLPGGCPYNTAITIGKLGIPVMFLGRFSTDFFGEALVKRLRDHGVKDDLMIRTSQNTTLAFVKTEKGKDPSYVFYAEGTAACSLVPEDLPKKLPLDTHCIVFGSIAMTVEPVSSTIEALIVKENALQGIGKESPVISYDPNVRPFMIKDKKAFIKHFEKCVAVSTIAKISAADFEYIYPGLDLEKALLKIIGMGPRLVISTQGSKGAVALLRRNDGSVVRASSPAVILPVVDTIGAGDTFHGAFLSWLELRGLLSRSSIASLTEEELHDALLFANKAASLVCTKQGAEPPSLREISALKESKPSAKAVKSAASSRAAPRKTAAVKKPSVKTPAAKKKK